MLTPFLSSLSVVVLLVSTLVSSAATKNSELVGRWRSDTAETGYWIVDRYADGRYAKKQYLEYDLSKPAEVNLEWGRWKLRGGKYSETITGTTSSFLKQFIGKATTWKILGVEAKRFSFESHDGYPRREQREHVSGPLLEIGTPAPVAAHPKEVIDTVTPSKKQIPDWISSQLPHEASNQSVELTATRRTIIFKDDYNLFTSSTARPRWR